MIQVQAGMQISKRYQIIQKNLRNNYKNISNKQLIEDYYKIILKIQHPQEAKEKRINSRTKAKGEIPKTIKLMLSCY